MEPLSLGPVVIPGYVAHAVLALAPAFLALVLWTRSDGEHRKAAVDLISTALLIFVLLWKLGPLFSSPGLVIEEPRLLLVGRGGAAGVAAGGIGAAIYLAMSVLRRRLLTPRFLTALGVFLAVAAVVYGGIAFATSGGGGPRVASGDGESGKQEAPDFVLEGLDGGTFSLAAAEGAPVVLNFWATWCGPCEIETPVKKRLATELGDRAHFVGVNLTTSEGGVDDVARYVSEHGIEYPVVLDTSGRVQQLYGVRGTPTTYIIDAEGRVVHKFMGAMSYGDMMRRLEPLLAAAGG